MTRHQTKLEVLLLDDTAVTEREMQAVTELELPAASVTSAAELPARFEIFHESKPTGVKGTSYHETLELGVALMTANPSWKAVKVLEGESFRGGVWRNPKEGRLIKSKDLG